LNHFLFFYFDFIDKKIQFSINRSLILIFVTVPQLVIKKRSFYFFIENNNNKKVVYPNNKSCLLMKGVRSSL